MIVLSHFSLFSQAGAILVQRLVGVGEVIVDVLACVILMTIILFMKVIDFFVIFMIFITF